MSTANAYKILLSIKDSPQWAFSILRFPLLVCDLGFVTSSESPECSIMLTNGCLKHSTGKSLGLQVLLVPPWWRRGAVSAETAPFQPPPSVPIRPATHPAPPGPQRQQPTLPDQPPTWTHPARPN